MLNDCSKALAYLKDSSDLTEDKADTIVPVETLINT
jgi:hypothetical protein